MKCLAIVKDGKLQLDDMQEYLRNLQKLNGEKVTVKIEKFKKARSLGENSYFHGVVCQILSDELGYSPEEIKGILKWKFKIKSTADLSTVEFEEFMTKVRVWVSGELGIYIPSPNEDITQLLVI
jgi:hypothetical protein